MAGRHFVEVDGKTKAVLKKTTEAEAFAVRRQKWFADGTL